MMASAAASSIGVLASPPVKYLVFDIDDTLYPVTNGFTQHRLNSIVLKYCVDRLGFENPDAADAFRRPYFEKYHSTLKALAVAGEEGTLPPHEDGTRRVFDSNDLANYWAEQVSDPQSNRDTPDR
jgi:FMN phosphatase YigB (HAD superfamily)